MEKRNREEPEPDWDQLIQVRRHMDLLAVCEVFIPADAEVKRTPVHSLPRGLRRRLATPLYNGHAPMTTTTPLSNGHAPSPMTTPRYQDHAPSPTVTPPFQSPASTSKAPPTSQDHASTSMTTPPYNGHASTSRATPTSQSHTSTSRATPPSNGPAYNPMTTPTSQSHASSPMTTPLYQGHASTSRATPPSQSHASSPKPPPTYQDHAPSPMTTPLYNGHASSPMTTPRIQDHASSSTTTPPSQSHASTSRATPPSQSHASSPKAPPTSQDHAPSHTATPPYQDHASRPDEAIWISPAVLRKKRQGIGTTSGAILGATATPSAPGARLRDKMAVQMSFVSSSPLARRLLKAVAPGAELAGARELPQDSAPPAGRSAVVIHQGRLYLCVRGQKKARGAPPDPQIEPPTKRARKRCRGDSPRTPHAAIKPEKKKKKKVFPKRKRADPEQEDPGGRGGDGDGGPIRARLNAEATLAPPPNGFDFGQLAQEEQIAQMKARLMQSEAALATNALP